MALTFIGSVTPDSNARQGITTNSAYPSIEDVHNIENKEEYLAKLSKVNQISILREQQEIAEEKDIAEAHYYQGTSEDQSLFLY